MRTRTGGYYNGGDKSLDISSSNELNYIVFLGINRHMSSVLECEFYLNIIKVVHRPANTVGLYLLGLYGIIKFLLFFIIHQVQYKFTISFRGYTFV